MATALLVPVTFYMSPIAAIAVSVEVRMLWKCATIAGSNSICCARIEIADTFTVGAVYQPHWLPGFSVSVDCAFLMPAAMDLIAL